MSETSSVIHYLIQELVIKRYVIEGPVLRYWNTVPEYHVDGISVGGLITALTCAFAFIVLVSVETTIQIRKDSRDRATS